MGKIIPENASFFEKMTACFGNLTEFEQKIQQLAEIAHIDLSQFEIDHLAVRMNSNETAERWETLLLQGANCLKESNVNGRPIGLFELHQAVVLCKQNVKIVELPFPKGGSYTSEGWEHIEIVFSMLKNETVEGWTTRVIAFFKLKDNPNVTIKINKPAVEGEKLPNPTVKITVKVGVNSAMLCKGVCLKIHPYDIKRIVQSES